ncbi:glutamate--tRNA ligase family protein [Mucilaginibacter myungsuensis]|uniref:tRNA glutamyl-Q synthetase n=1 Tax=Mucilaginibacter myungsuensis TaxID=649104 RepID=A0A929KT92_9SPHI|nr:glutamate--tRNA ligase family protein [Mucilaginibacter myungsuensis]MBE9661136.1 tRNA glutamyl-Q synthetase [Mucilaginibacter myungsuensis]MDN3597281.1 glutamate--tRNA ligase family protein [Mucilaginibacter myungsuensis]
MDQPAFAKTRIAPTPSGYLHLGNVLSFAITAGIAQRTGARILLRIDDLDRARVYHAYVQDVFDTLEFLQIPYHQGPGDFKEFETQWSQLQRMGMYNATLKKLADDGAVFACDCSRAQIKSITGGESYPGTCLHKNLPLDAPNVSWRLKTDAAPVIIKDLFGDAVATSLPATMQHFVVRKKDGYPAYQLTSVLDDIHYRVDLIVRGSDLWDSTLAQLYLAPLIGADAILQTTFYHHTLLMATNGEKLSKSAGSTSIKYLRETGKSATDIFTMIAQLIGSNEPINNWDDLSRLILPPLSPPTK